ncbi:hypothetical protein Taro_027079 [Colocasia esculenta]|uniref:Aminotransferase-like plant mobile domain-containing protein n=1 Tax=Colocasia esculenta TaxID=4460 RepID=A0A843VEQ0_COLES|nr:hypothetical protein [Colocasia esculenta]
MRARVSWLLVLAVYQAFPAFQRERLEGMGFGEVLRMDRMRADPALTQALRSRWDAEATAFVFPWGHMIPSLEDVSRITGLRVYGRPVSGFTYPCYQDLAHRLLGLTVEKRSSLLSRVELQESLGLYEMGKKVGETVDEQLQRLTQGCRAVLAEELEVEADQDLRRLLILFLGRLLFATRGDAVHYRFLPLLEDLDEVWAYLHLSVLRRGFLERPGLVPIVCRWDSRRDTHTLSDQLAALQDAIDSYPQLEVVWQPYLEEGGEGQPWFVQARPYFGRSSPVEFPSRDRTLRPSRSFRGLHDNTDWRERAKKQIQNWEHRGKQVKSFATTDDAYLQAFALKYGEKVYRGARRQVDVTGETASLRALLYSVVQDREIAQREAEQLRKELERVRRAVGAGASSSRAAEGSQSDLEDRLAAAERELRTTTDRASQLQGQVDAVTGERDRLCIRAEAAELLVAEKTWEVATLWVQGSSADQTEMARLHTEVTAQQITIDELRGLVTTLGQTARSRTDMSGASGASIRQYLAGSSSRRRNEEEERRRRGEASTQSGRGGGEMPPPPERQEGSRESGSGQ